LDEDGAPGGAVAATVKLASRVVVPLLALIRIVYWESGGMSLSKDTVSVIVAVVAKYVIAAVREERLVTGPTPSS
jgi:hypothetical protein